MPTPNEAQRKALEAVVARATTDREFRQWLLRDPKEAIREAFGIHIPPGVRIQFIERHPDLDALIVLPDFKRSDAELSDADLENVAGGTDVGAAWADEAPQQW